MLSQGSYRNTVLVAFLLALVCSIFVSSLAIFFRGRITLNQNLEKKKNILEAAGLYDENQSKSMDDILDLFNRFIEKRLVDLNTGMYANSINIETYDPKIALKDKRTTFLPKNDVAGIGLVAKVAIIYLVKDTSGNISRLVLPVYGKGLWSTMYGFISIKSDFSTVDGLTFYAHGETPGLGGEIDNPFWKKQWVGKKVYDEKFNVKLKVIRGKTISTSSDFLYEVDGLSGATITSRGVTNLILFWLGKEGYGLFLQRLRNAELVI